MLKIHNLTAKKDKYTHRRKLCVLKDSTQQKS